jgi:hypothetical protein
MMPLTSRCTERPKCVCGRHYEDGHDAETHDSRTLCDGTRVTLLVTWVSRERAALDLARDVTEWRNYEIEDALSKLLGGAWIVRGECPYNGDYCASDGKAGP